VRTLKISYGLVLDLVVKSQFARNMSLLKDLDEKAFQWLDKMAQNTWCRAYFSTFPKCDVLVNNSCEVFNRYILDARELLILSMLQTIKGQLMTRHYNKQKEMDNFVGTIYPKIRKKVAKNVEFANICYALPAGKGVFQVQSRDCQYIVDICSKECECRRWQLIGIPCSNGIACLRHERIPLNLLLPVAT